MCDTEILSQEQDHLPGIEPLEKRFFDMMGTSISTEWIARVLDWDIRTVQNWAKNGIISPDSNGLYKCGDSFKKLDHWRVDTINRKKPETPEGLESADEADRRRKVHEANIKGFDEDERRRDLLPRKEVEAVAFEMARQLRESFENIPSRIGDIIAAESNPAKVKQLLGAEINRVLEHLSK